MKTSFNCFLKGTWKKLLAVELKKEYIGKLQSYVAREYRGRTIYPAAANIFNAFKYTPFEKVRVVLLGQDPYHGEGQAHGLSFSVPRGVRLPPSLKNIFKELAGDLKIRLPEKGNLAPWARQGVFLLNSVLTVAAGKPGSHRGKGWETFTDTVIRVLSEKKERLVFLLWGNYAREKKKLIDKKKHLVLEAPHPSPLSAHTGFYGCRHFSKANRYLGKYGAGGIEWDLG